MAAFNTLKQSILRILSTSNPEAHMRPRSVALLIVPVLVLLSCADPVAPDYGERVSFYEAVDIALAYLEEEDLYENGDSIAFYEVESHLDTEGKGADWVIVLKVNEYSYKVYIRYGEAFNHIIMGQRDGPFILTGGLLDTDTIMSIVSSYATIADEVRFVLKPSIEDYDYPCWESNSFNTTIECNSYVGQNINFNYKTSLPVINGICNYSNFNNWDFQASVYNDSVFKAQETYIKNYLIYYYYIEGYKISENQWDYCGYVASEFYDDYVYEGDSNHEIIRGVAEISNDYIATITYNIVAICDAYDGSIMFYIDEE
jgi:hypothetical protein